MPGSLVFSSALLPCGVWPFIRQKPYDVIANPTDVPKSIFISNHDLKRFWEVDMGTVQRHEWAVSAHLSPPIP